MQQPKESEGSPGLASVMPVSKDEEEVAETLNALAEMFSDSDKIEMAKSTGKLCNAKSYDSQTKSSYLYSSISFINVLLHPVG